MTLIRVAIVEDQSKLHQPILFVRAESILSVKSTPAQLRRDFTSFFLGGEVEEVPDLALGVFRRC